MKNIDKIRQMREENPNIRAADIAVRLNVSRESVRQSLVKLGLPTKVIGSYTSKTVRTNNTNKRYDSNIHISASNTGAVCELQVCADLLIKGFNVFRSVSPHSKCDLIALKDDITIKIEVRASRNFKCVAHGTYNVLAAVNPNGDILYKPSLDSFFND